ncbi:MAG: molybdate ABC transporter substrate-binding protein [Planctomycetes bacterium]|nr:molybdate ABC transporter substrate-binding protein [Planctomycetota bacterium]
MNGNQKFGLIAGLILVAVVVLGSVLSSGKDEVKADAPAAQPKPVVRKTLTVFAAASMTNVIADLKDAYEKEHPCDIKLNLASSSKLARQIEAGAGADIFCSANVKWSDYLKEKGLIAESKSDIFAGNRLVVIAPKDGKLADFAVDADANFPAKFEGRLALGDPAHVPAGIYAKEALTHFKWFGALEKRLAPAANVREALMLVENGEVEAGIVYSTDAAQSAKVKVVGTFPEDSHSKISYTISVVKDSDAEAGEFYKFMFTPKAKGILKKYGFHAGE